MTRRFVFGLLLSVVSLAICAQNYQIKGTVISKTTREPLEFVNVLVVGLNVGASTDINGNFTINSVPPGIYQLRASTIGYKTVFTEEYRVNHITPHINIEMEEESTSISEVTVTASPFRRVAESPVSLRVIGLQEIE